MADIPNVDQDFVRFVAEGKRYIINSPWFRYLDAINVTKKGAILDVVNGGTGVNTATGIGSTVRANGPTLNLATLTSPLFTGIPRVRGALFWEPFGDPFPKDPNLGANDKNQVSVTAVATTIVDTDLPIFFIVHDKTSGGMTVGVMDSVGGVVTPAAFAGIAGIAFTRAAGVGLQAAVTAGANPRVLSTFAVNTGAQ